MANSSDLTSAPVATKSQSRPVPTMISVEPMDFEDCAFPSPAARTPIGVTPVGLRTSRELLTACASPMADYWGDGKTAALDASPFFPGFGTPVERTQPPCDVFHAQPNVLGTMPASSFMPMAPQFSDYCAMPATFQLAWPASQGHEANQFPEHLIGHNLNLAYSPQVISIHPERSGVPRANLAQMPTQHDVAKTAPDVSSTGDVSAENVHSNVTSADPVASTSLPCPEKVFVDLKFLVPKLEPIS